MRGHPLILRALRALFSRRALTFVVRTAAILSMAFAAAFGFLGAISSPAAAYDPHTRDRHAALFGAACGAIGLMLSWQPDAAPEAAQARERADDLSDRNWELKEAEERAKSFSKRRAT